MVFAMTPAQRCRAIVERVLRDRQPLVRPDIGEVSASEPLSDADLDRLWLEAGCSEGWTDDDVDLADRLSDGDYGDLWVMAGRPEVLDVDDALRDAERAWEAYWEAFDRLEDYLRARVRAAFLGTADVQEAMERLAAIAQSRPELAALDLSGLPVQSQPSTCAITANAPPALSVPAITGATA